MPGVSYECYRSVTELYHYCKEVSYDFNKIDTKSLRKIVDVQEKRKPPPSCHINPSKPNRSVHTGCKGASSEYLRGCCSMLF
jgi:hypothetical protein